MSEWKEYRLGDIADCALGKMLDQKKNQGTPRPYLNNVSLRWGSFNIDNSQTMLFEDSELERYQIKKNDIIMCEGGEPGRCAVWTNESPICYQKALHRIRVKEGFDNWFLYYYLRHFVFSGRAQVFFTGTTIKHLPLQALKSLVIKAPAFQAQQKIASILSSLDSKIENNRKICANLEAQAQALFKHWFIDFAPFKDGKFVESELGMIPEGWRVGRLGEIADITMGQSPSGSSYNEDGNGSIFYQGRTDFGFRFPSIRLFTTEPKRFAEPLSTLLSVRAPVGDINVATEKCCIGRGLASIKSKNNHHSFIYYLLKSKKRTFDVYNGEGTVFGSINKDTLNGLSLVVPPVSAVKAFNDLVEGLDCIILENNNENLRLTTLRDTLLPKLMSGEIKV